MTILYEKFAGNDVAFLVIFAIMFLVIVGGSLFLTPKIARWVDEHRKKKPGFYDGMLEEAPDSVSAEDEDNEECLK